LTVAIPSRGIPLPGFGAPAVGFDTPFEMLEACHERVQRTLALQQRLCEHLQTTGCDASARSAAGACARLRHRCALAP
jgi:hypothetical protein